MKGNKMTLNNFLQNNMTWWDYENLHEHLGESRKMATMIIEQTTSPKKLHIEKIVELLQKHIPEVDAGYLRAEFDFTVEETAVTPSV